MREGGRGGADRQNGQSDYLNSEHGRSSLWLWYLSYTWCEERGGAALEKRRLEWSMGQGGGADRNI